MKKYFLNNDVYNALIKWKLDIMVLNNFQMPRMTFEEFDIENAPELISMWINSDNPTIDEFVKKIKSVVYFMNGQEVFERK